MVITQKSEDEVVIALHDHGLDIALTIGALLEGTQVFNLIYDVLLIIFSKDIT